jgi:hypothetical protein
VFGYYPEEANAVTGRRPQQHCVNKRECTSIPACEDGNSNEDCTGSYRTSPGEQCGVMDIFANH